MKQTRSVAFALSNGTVPVGGEKQVWLFKLVGEGGMKAKTTEKDQKGPKLQIIESNENYV